MCVSRAVANLSVLAEYCLPFIKVGGRLAALKGPDAAAEAEQAKGATEKLGGRLVEIKDVAIPHTDLSHKLVFIEKLHPPKNTPRNAGKIKRNRLVESEKAFVGTVCVDMGFCGTVFSA